MPRNIFKFIYYKFTSILRYLLELARPSEITDYRNIPIIINNFNRLGYLKKLLESLEIRGYSNIFIIDNCSSYPPLLEFYDNCKYQVFRMKKNYGAYSLWKSGLYNRFRKNYFAYTDSDIEPIEECPADFLNYFLLALKRHRLASKVGFSLKIDDIPDCFKFKKNVVDHEHTFSRFFMSDESLYYAPIDTTFALYRPRTSWKHANYNIEIYRTAFPYMARHLPWYIDSNNPDEENRYYFETANNTATLVNKEKQMLSDRVQIKN